MKYNAENYENTIFSKSIKCLELALKHMLKLHLQHNR